MLSNVSAFSKTSAGILLALLIPAILLLTGCPSPTSSQDQTTYYIKCTITDGGGTATHYEFYKGFIVSNDPAKTEQLENGTIPACTLVNNNYEITGTAGPHAPLDFSQWPDPSPYSGVDITIDTSGTQWSLDDFTLTIVNTGSSIAWSLPLTPASTLTVSQTPGSVGDVFAAEFTAAIEDDNGNPAALSGSFYLKRMDDDI